MFIKRSKKHMYVKAIRRDNIPRDSIVENPISRNENSNLLPNTPIRMKMKLYSNSMCLVYFFMQLKVFFKQLKILLEEAFLELFFILEKIFLK